jgi:hypothetical protein
VKTTACLLTLLTAVVPLRAVEPERKAQAWQTLKASLTSDSAHRQEALAAIGTISEHDVQAVKAATDALQDKNTFVRQSAALALGSMKATEAVPALKQALDDSGEVAFAAAKALTEIGDPAGRELLITVLAGERKDIKPGLMTNAIRKGKSKLNHPGGLVLTGAQDATGAMFGPVSFVFPAVKDAVDLKGKGAPGRAAAAAYLARDPEPYAVTVLEWALKDENQFVRLSPKQRTGKRPRRTSYSRARPAGIWNSFGSRCRCSIWREMIPNGLAHSKERCGSGITARVTGVIPSGIAPHTWSASG